MRVRRHKLSLVFLTLFTTITLTLAGTAQAAEPRLIGTYGDWSSYIFTEDGNKVCFMASQPKKAEGNYTKRGEIYALLTHRPAEGTKNVFSYIAGYGYKTGSDATVKFGNTRYTLFTQDETAWAPDAATDNKMANSIRKGSNFTVSGMSQRGTKTIDTFSLKGSSAAHDAISRECKS